jgi:hypothetical protein
MSDGPYDYARERDDAQDADRWRYATPGQWVGGEWRTAEVGDMREDA